MSTFKLPTVKDIMATRHCSRSRAESLRALLEVQVDEVCSRITGQHFLDVVNAANLERDPSLATR